MTEDHKTVLWCPQSETFCEHSFADQCAEQNFHKMLTGQNKFKFACCLANLEAGACEDEVRICMFGSSYLYVFLCFFFHSFSPSGDNQMIIGDKCRRYTRTPPSPLKNKRTLPLKRSLVMKRCSASHKMFLIFGLS